MANVTRIKDMGGEFSGVGVYETQPCSVCHKKTELVLSDMNVLALKEQFVQDVYPEQSVGFRELLISGTHDECWDMLFPEEDEEE